MRTLKGQRSISMFGRIRGFATMTCVDRENEITNS